MIEAAQRLGIYIPRFCFHEALGAVGACRVCAVKIEEGPVKGLQMSCMTDAEDGMRVLTNDPDAVEFRKSVIEWLMINHPHDCPVCDEGGHCLLQDLTVAGGHGRRRYTGKKRTYADQYLGSLVHHEMNRCIQCYRCVRYYQDYAGYKDLGVMGIAGRVFFGRFSDGMLKSPFSGNLIDICPTGVYTDKPSRYYGRRWDYQRSPGVCIHCSLGCATMISSRHRRIPRIESRFNPEVNGWFICDRGRYGFEYTNAALRPRIGKTGSDRAAPQEAAAEALVRISDIETRFGPGAIGVIASGRSSLETLFAAGHLCRSRGFTGPALWRRETAAKVMSAVSSLSPDLAISLAQIESADRILVIGADPVNEAPVLALSLRQAARKKAKILVIDPRPVALPFECAHVNLRRADLSGFLGRLSEAMNADSQASAADEQVRVAADMLEGGKFPVIICGTDTTDAQTVTGAGLLAEKLQKTAGRAGLFCILPAANSFGAALLDLGKTAIEDLLEGIENENIKALIAVESDLWETYPDRSRLEAALSRLELLVVLDCLDSGLSERAHVFIPVQTVFESGGIFVNSHGQVQQSMAAHSGGFPISITGNGGHPPRTFSLDIPGTGMPPAWQTLVQWEMKTAAPPAHEQVIGSMIDACAELAPVKELPGTGARVRVPDAHKKTHPIENGADERNHDFEVILTDALFGADCLGRYSPWLREREQQELLINTADAEALGVTDGGRVRINLDRKPLDLTARVSSRVAKHTLVLPRLLDLFWQQADADGRFISKKKILLL